MKLTVDDCLIKGIRDHACPIYGAGRGITAIDAQVEITRSKLDSLTGFCAGTDFPGIWAMDSDIVARDDTLSHCEACQGIVGAMFVEGGTVSLERCLFWENNGDYGPADVKLRDVSSALIENCLFLGGNGDFGSVEAIRTALSMRHCFIDASDVYYSGEPNLSGVLSLRGVDLDLDLCTIVGWHSNFTGINVCDMGSGVASNVFCENSILWSDVCDVFHAYESPDCSSEFRFSALSDPIVGPGNLYLKPRFSDSLGHQSSFSPGVDAGDPGDDYGEEPPYDGRRLNIGAHGNTPEAVASSPEIATSIPSGIVDMSYEGWTSHETDVLTIRSNDEDEPELQIILNAVPYKPDIPASVDLLLFNAGESRLNIESVENATPLFTVDAVADTFLLTNETGNSEVLRIRIDMVPAALPLAAGASIPERYALLPCSPNPFNPWTKIAFDLPRPGVVSLRIYDVTGRLVRSMLDEALCEAGRHAVIWNGRDDAKRDVASGVYFYRIEAGDYRATERMILLR
jgi:hypothetical protein